MSLETSLALENQKRMLAEFCEVWWFLTSIKRRHIISSFRFCFSRKKKTEEKIKDNLLTDFLNVEILD